MRITLILAGIIVVVLMIVITITSSPTSENFQTGGWQCADNLREKVFGDLIDCQRNAWTKKDSKQLRQCYETSERIRNCCYSGPSPDCVTPTPRPFSEDPNDKWLTSVSQIDNLYFHHAASGLTLYPLTYCAYAQQLEMVAYYDDRGKAPERIRLQMNLQPPYLEGSVVVRASKSCKGDVGATLMKCSIDARTGDLTLEGVPDGLWSSPSTRVKKGAIRLDAKPKWPALQGVGVYVDGKTWWSGWKQLVVVPPGDLLSHAIVFPPVIDKRTIADNGFVGRWIKLEPSMFQSFPYNEDMLQSLMQLKVLGKTFLLRRDEM